MAEQKNLEQLIEALDAACASYNEIPADQRVDLDVVRIEWGLLKLGAWRSYRDVYGDLALGFEKPGAANDVDIFTFRDVCLNLIGSEIIGYKGGEYTVREDTSLWVSEWGYASGVAITGFKQAAGMFLLETAIID